MPEAPETTTEEDGGKLGRIATEARGLVDDTKDWVDAKLRLFELDLEQKIDGIANRVVVWGVIAFMLALALAFALAALAFALGNVWESTTLGFLAVAGGILLLALVVHLVRPRFVRGTIGAATRKEPQKSLETTDPAKRLPPGPNGRHD